MTETVLRWIISILFHTSFMWTSIKVWKVIPSEFNPFKDWLPALNGNQSLNSEGNFKYIFHYNLFLPPQPAGQLFKSLHLNTAMTWWPKVAYTVCSLSFVLVAPGMFLPLFSCYIDLSSACLLFSHHTYHSVQCDSRTWTPPGHLQIGYKMWLFCSDYF